MNSNLHLRAIAQISFAKRVCAPPEPLARLKCTFVENLVSSLYKSTENELQGSGMTISKKNEEGP
jgi:hypothetical protein